MQTQCFDDVPMREWYHMDADVNLVGCEFPQLHDHKDYWEFWIVMDGKCVHRINGKDYHMEGGDGILIRPKDRHCSQNAGQAPFSHIVLAVREILISRMLALTAGGPELEQELLTGKELFFYLNAEEFKKVVRYATTYQTQNKAELSSSMTAHLLCSYLLEIVLSGCFGEQEVYPDLVLDLIRAINKPENCASFPRDIIKNVNYSQQHISRIFKKYTGKTLTEYMNEVKMKAACEMLRSGQYTTLQISGMLGFDSLSYFNHLFKSTCGMTPRQFSKQGHPN